MRLLCFEILNYDMKKILKIIEPEIGRVIYYREERIIKKHWWSKKIIYPEGWYEGDSDKIASINYSTEFLILDESEEKIGYICKCGYAISLDDEKLVAKRLKFNDIDKLKSPL